MVESTETNKYYLVDIYTRDPYVLITHSVVDAANTMVIHPSDWSIILVGIEKRIYNAIDRCLVPFYECIFTKVNLWLPIPKFEV